jgi:hypothetical protein
MVITFFNIRRESLEMLNGPAKKLKNAKKVAATSAIFFF